MEGELNVGVKNGIQGQLESISPGFGPTGLFCTHSTPNRR